MIKTKKTKKHKNDRASELVSKQCLINDGIINLFFVFSASRFSEASCMKRFHYTFCSNENENFALLISVVWVCAGVLSCCSEFEK